VLCIAYIAPSKVTVIYPFTGYKQVGFRYPRFCRLIIIEQKWNGSYFEHVSLKSLGLRIRLGHLNGICSLPQPAFNDDFVVIHTNGIHEVAIDYCGCQQSIPKTIQLLRARLFPSTVIDPKTAATFKVLDTFQMLSFTSKVSAYEFYQALARRTDNTGTSTPSVRFHVRRMSSSQYGKIVFRIVTMAFDG